MIHRISAFATGAVSLSSVWRQLGVLCVPLLNSASDLMQRELQRDFSSAKWYDFRQAKRWEDVRAMLFSLEPDIRMQEIALAMNTLKLFGRSVPVSFLDEIGDLILKNSQQLDRPRDLGDVLHACAKLKYFDPLLITAIVKSIVSGQCEVCGFDNRGLSTMVYSLGQMQHLWTQGSDDQKIDIALILQLLEKITAELQAPYRVDYLDAHTVISLLYGLGMLQYTENKEAVDYLLEWVFKEDVLANLTEQQFSMFTTALHSLEVFCTDAQWTLIDKELCKTERLEGLSQQGICNVMRRLGIMGFPHKESMEGLAFESVKPERMKNYICQDLANLVHTIAVRKLQPEVLLPDFEDRVVEPSVLRHFKEQELCNVIYGFALGRSEDKEALFEILGREAIKRQRMSLYTQQGLSMIIYSFGLVKFGNVEILQHLAHECIRPERLKDFSAQALSNIIYGLGRLRSDSELLGRFAEVLLSEAGTKERVAAFNEQALANIIYSLAQLIMPQYLNTFLTETCKHARLIKLSDQGLSNILQSLSWLKYNNPKGIKILMTEAVRRTRSEDLSETATTNILSAAMRFELREPDFILPLLKRSVKKDKLKLQKSEELISILERYVRFDLRESAVVNSVVYELTLKSRLKELDNKQLVEILKLLWNLRMASSKAIPKIVNEISAAKRWSTLSPFTLADMITTLAWLQYPDQHIFDEACEELTLVSSLHVLESAQIISVLQSLKPSFVATQYSDKFIERLCERANQLEAHQLVDVLQFHVTFGLRVEARIKRCLHELTDQRKLMQLTLKDVAISLESIIAMGLQDLEEVSNLVTALDNPMILKHCRVHYVAKMIICLCRLGRAYKSKTMKLVEKLVEPPWSGEIAEKDLTEVFQVIKEVGYEYGKLGRLLNRHREERSSFFLEEEDMYLASDVPGITRV